MAIEGTIKSVDGKKVAVIVGSEKDAEGKDQEKIVTVNCREAKCLDGIGNDAKPVPISSLKNGDRIQLRGDPVHSVIVLGDVEEPSYPTKIDRRHAE